MPELHIASLVVQHLAGSSAAIKAAVAALDGVEWIAAENGKAVVTLVGASEGAVLDHIAAIGALPDVLTATLVYHAYDDTESDAGPPVPETSNQEHPPVECPQ